MANEITVQQILKVANGNLQHTLQSAAISVDQANLGGPTPGYLTIGTTEESVTFAELTAEGWLYMRNLDATNFVQWGFAAAAYGGRMKAGEPAMFRLEPNTTLYMKADTADCKVEVWALED